jgi:anti-anti-sigma factor
MVVGLPATGYLDCLAVHALLDAQEAVMARGATMALACPRPIVARALQLTGADQRIPVYGSVAEAAAGTIGPL